MKPALSAAAAVALIGLSPDAARALSIIPVFDSSVTSLSNASAVEAAFTAVANEFDASFATPVTVKIGVSWGKVNGRALPSGDVSSSQSPLTGPFAYDDITGIFADDAAANPGDANIALAAANLPVNSPAGALPFEIPYAQAQALGYLPATMNPDSGYVGFSSTVSWDLNPADGTTSGAYDFEAMAAHEISEVLGRITGLGSAKPTYATMLDTLRYSAPGVSSFSYSASAYLSVDGGVTSLGAFNVSGNGDRSDWNAIAGDAQDASVKTGTTYALSYNDLELLDVLGWGAATPLPSGTIGGISVTRPGAAMGVLEPGTWTLMLLGLGLVGAAVRAAPRRPAVGISTVPAA